MFGRKSNAVKVEPMDEYNQLLVDHVHPSDWKNPNPRSKYNLVVVGAGSAGLITAAAAAGLGAKVALVEKHLMGGDCLNHGCVPSKALIRAAKAVNEVRKSPVFGVDAQLQTIDFSKVMERLRRIRSDISHHDSAKRFSEMGIDVFLGQGSFIDESTIEVDGSKLNFKKACIATGAKATKIPLDGIKQDELLTNETIFSLTELPKRLAIVGGGPIGCELAQAFARLGSEVTIFERGPQFLTLEDPDAASILKSQMEKDGVSIKLNSTIFSGKKDGNSYKLFYCVGSEAETSLEVDKILMAVGRSPNLDGLEVEKAGIEFSKNGVEVDDYLRTSNKKIFAAGDVCMRHKFTHAADFAARAVVRNALFFSRAKLSALNIPWATYTDPEIAHVGVYGHSSDEPVDTYFKPFKEVDRAILDEATDGFVKIHTKKGSGKIVGATIVGPHAGDQISEVSVAMAAGMKLGKLANVIHPYPTQSEAIRQTGDLYNKTKLTPLTKTFLKSLVKFS